MEIKQLYNIMLKSKNGEISYLSEKEYEAYLALYKCTLPLKKDNADMFNEIQQLFLDFSEAQRFSAFKAGFRSASELILSSLNQ